MAFLLAETFQSSLEQLNGEEQNTAFELGILVW